MVERKNLTNLEIYNYATLLLEHFQASEMNFPVKVSFYLQKNIDILVELAKDVEKNRIEIIKKYGVASEDNEEQYVVAPENIEVANNELNDLLALTQEVSLNMLKLDWFDNIDLTNAQVKAISIMIAEE